ncbi:DUF1697 domain-containing protein [Labrys neptuniae]|uniref:DUF1697 domain-containing protein n=1 Tax=Labrys neptuniae TaxID=376174 RepID=UPI0028907271|nr:DUF1697 domain-containing protein [Labrys neptuniae]MDT3380736.1 DUF1697 domain-containing protein [Labrys neptuniae]
MRYIALLRAINVGGSSTIKMAELRALGEDFGFSGVTTLLQSGNLTFEAREAALPDLEQRWEQAVFEKFGVSTTFVIRTTPEWQAMIDANPYPREAADDPAHLLALPSKHDIDPSAVASLRVAIRERESVAAGERCLYAHYPDGIGRSKLTTKLIERHLGTLVTGRNWNTVLKLVA